MIALLRAGVIDPAEPPRPREDEPAAGGPVVVVGDDLQEYYAKIAQGKTETIRHLIDTVIGFVLSREYVRIAREIEKKIGKGDT